MRALAEDPAFDGVDSGLDVFDLGPLVVTGHGDGEMGDEVGVVPMAGGESPMLAWRLAGLGSCASIGSSTTGAD